MIYVSSLLNYKVRTDLENRPIETLWVELKLKSQIILLCCYYRSFLPGHSTVHHLIELIHHTCLALEKYEINCQIFCDISKALDRVCH